MANEAVHEVGDQVRICAAFSRRGEAFDPRRVAVRIRSPRGAIAELVHGTDAQVVRTGPGTYEVVVAATVPGRWQWRFYGAGGDSGAVDGAFHAIGPEGA